MHEDGSISIQDRSKDIIISGGEVRTVNILDTSSSIHLTIPVLRMLLV